MLLKNDATSIAAMRISFQVSNDLKRFMKQEIEYAVLWDGFAAVARAIARTGFETSVGSYPRVFNFKDFLQITLDQPFTLNVVSGIIHGGEQVLDEITVVTQKKKKSILSTPKLKNGLLFETPLTLIIHAWVQREYVKIRNDRTYNKLDAIGKSRADAQLRDLEAHLDTLDELPGASYLFPENIFAMNNNDLLMNTYLTTPWLDGVEKVDITALSTSNNELINDYFLKAVDAYKGVFGLAGGLEDIKIDLRNVGVLVEPDPVWLRISNSPYYEGSMTFELREYVTKYPQQILAMFPYFLKNTYYGMELTPAELGSTLYDFGRVISKLFSTQVRGQVENQLSDKYELIGNIMAGIETPMTMADMVDFIHYHHLRTGAIKFEIDAADIELNLAEIRILKRAINDLRSPIHNLSEEEQAKYTYRATERKIAVQMPDRVILLRAVGRDFVVDPHGAVKSVMNPNSGLGYKAIELFEQIQSLYIATLDPSLTPADLFNLDAGKYKFKLNSNLLNQQMHFGFVGQKPTIFLSE